MTNKTEMVSAPLCATEEMKRAGMERMAQAQRDGSASLYAYAAVCWEAMIECYQESATPAEDVRAVGEEPMVFDEEFQRAKFIQHFKLDGRIYFDSTTKQWLPTRDSIEGFQMAERVVGLWIGWRTCAEKWNACLDAVEELNK